MARTWKREHNWQYWLSLYDIIAVTERAEKLVAAAAGNAEFRYWADLSQPHSRVRASESAEFQRDMADVPPSAWEVIIGRSQAPWNSAVQLEAVVMLTKYLTPMVLRVEGTDRTAVEGIFAQLIEWMNERSPHNPPELEVHAAGGDNRPSVPRTARPSETLGIGVEGRVGDHVVAAPDALSPESAERREGRWRDPWVVTVAGGLIVTVGGGAVLLWLFG